MPLFYTKDMKTSFYVTLRVCFVEQLLVLNTQSKRDVAFKTFMNKMNAAERSVQEQGYFTEEVEAEL